MESKARGDLLANAIYQRAREVVATGGRTRSPRCVPTPGCGPCSSRACIRATSPTRRSSIPPASPSCTATATRIGQPLPPYGDLNALLERGTVSQLRAIYADGGRTLEIRQPLLMGTAEFGSIRIGVSTLLIQLDLTRSLAPGLDHRDRHPDRRKPGGDGCWHSCRFARFTSSAAASRDWGRASSGWSWICRNATSSASSAISSTPSAPGCLPTARRPRRPCSAVASTRTRTRSKTPWRSSTPTRNCCSPTRPCGPSCLRDRPDPVARPVRELFPAGHPYRKAVEEAAATRQSRGPISAYLPEPRDRSGRRARPAGAARTVDPDARDRQPRPSARGRDARRAQSGLHDAGAHPRSATRRSSRRSAGCRPASRTK